MTKQYYLKRNHTEKVLAHRISHLNQNVLEMTHYWKVKCKERKTFTHKLSVMNGIIRRMKLREEKFNKAFHRSMFYTMRSRKHNAKPRYIVTLTFNEINRLRQFLNRGLFGVRNIKGKRIVRLNNSQYYKLWYILNSKKGIYET